MYFITDTCFWSHLKELEIRTNVNLRELINQFRWGFPQSVIEELSARSILEWINLEEAYIYPLSKKEQEIAIKKYPFLKDFDYADQEVIFIAKRDNSIILTDDGGLASTALSMGIDFLRVPDFILFLFQNSFIDKHIYSHIFKQISKMKRYKEKELKRWKKHELK
jgi:rRNA-processing protein FCF1